MRTMLRSKVTLLFSACAVAIFAVSGSAMALTTDGSGTTAASPMIQSDKADYAPWELVTLTGGNWQPGESVNIKVNDDAGQTWSRNVDVTADQSGSISDSFNLPDWFVATYSVTATGQQSGVATTSFTDGNVTVQTSGPTVSLTYGKWSSSNCSDPAGSNRTAQGTTPITSSSGQIAALAGNTGSLKLSVPATSGTQTFQNWTGQGGFSSANNTVCIDSVNGNRTFTANYSTAATTVDTTTTAASKNATYGDSSVTLTAAVAPTSGTSTVNNGTVTFTVKDGATTLGTVTSSTVSGGSASASFPLSGVNAGSYTILATYNAGTGFNGSNNSAQSPAPTLTVGKAASTTTVTCTGAPYTYTGSALTPCSASVTGVGGLNQPLTIGYTNNTGAGTATASASFAGDANHLASSDSKNFTIDKASSTTTVTCPTSPATYTGSALTPCSVSVKGAGGLDLSPDANYTDNTNAGTANASASYAGDANHLAGSDSTTFTIGKRPITVAADAKSKFFGDPDPALTYQLTSGSLVQGDSISGALTRVAGETVAGSPYAIQQGTLTAGGNYNINFVGANLTIKAWNFSGFYQPVDMNNTLNTIKGGSTVPIKFELFKGATELTDTGSVKALGYKEVPCGMLSSTTDDVELTATGGTVLRYDTTGGQYVYNWQTPKTVGKCYSVTISSNDLSSQTAYFKTK